MYCPESPPTAASRNRCHFTLRRRFVLAALFGLITLPASALERWQTLPPTPVPIVNRPQRRGRSPVIFLGGLANSDYWGNWVPAVAARQTAILTLSFGASCRA